MPDRTPTDLEYFVHQRAPDITSAIKAAAQKARMANLLQQAHVATAAGDAVRVHEIEAEIDRLAAQL